MKKLVLLLAVVFSVSLFSCGGSDAANGSDSDSVKKDSVKEAPAAQAETPAAPVVDSVA